jgi:PAS domain S-box-containing protein
VKNSGRDDAEEALRAQVKLTGDLLEAVPVAMAMRDAEGKYLFVNRTWEKYFGAKREQVVGRSIYERLPAELAERVLALDREALGRGPGSGPAFTVDDFEEGGRIYSQTRTVIADAQGGVLGVVVATHDITEHHATEQALRLEGQRLDLLVHSTKAGFSDWNATIDAVVYSERFKEMLGYPPRTDTSIWPGIFEMMHPEDRDPIREKFRGMLRRKEKPGRQEPGEALEFRLRHAAGGYIWVRTDSIVQMGDAGRARRVITSFHDISKFREQAELLRESTELALFEQHRLDLVVRAARAGIVDWDGKTHATYYSPRFREIRGYPAYADTGGWPDFFKMMIHPEDRERVSARFRDYIRGAGSGGPQEYIDEENCRISRADGSYVWIQVSGICVRDETGFATRFIAAITDATERRAHEEALRSSVRLREEVERMSRHDLKTPLSTVIAMSRLLRENSKQAPEDAELLDTIERAGYRILNMVNLSLDLFRMESGTYQFNPQPVDLAEVARKVAADLESQAASKNIDVRVRANNASAASNPVVAQADELLCYSMFANLLKNAIEAAPEGSIVSVSLRTQGEAVLAEVHNPGAVPEALRGRFFEKYATAGKSAGLGLGTYSAHLMARVQQGELTLRSSEEAGTTLTARLKAAEGMQARPPAGEAAKAEALALARSALPALHVLVVDDDEFNRLVLRRYLPTPPLTLAMAVNGRAALEAAERQWPDVVLLDLEMPVMDGYQTAVKLRELESRVDEHGRSLGRKRCRIVAVSSNDERAIMQRALAAGCDDYLMKPAPRDALWRILTGAPYRDAAPAGNEAQDDEAAQKQAVRSDPVFVDTDLRESLPTFLASRRQALDEMPQALAAGDRARFKRLAHRLAGSLPLYGLLWGAEQCCGLETDAEEGDAADLRARAAEVRAWLDAAAIEFRPGDNAVNMDDP